MFHVGSFSKSVQGLEPAVSEDCGLKLYVSDKLNFVGPLNRDTVNDEIEGCYKIFILLYFQLKYLIC